MTDKQMTPDIAHSILKKFYFSVYRIHLAVSGTVFLHDTHPAQTLRGGILYWFRRNVCRFPLNTECGHCSGALDCAYALLFTDNPQERFAPVMERVARRSAGKKCLQIPQPYIIRFSDDPKTRYKEGQTLTFEIVLVGDATDYIPLFIDAVTALGRHGLGTRSGRFDVGKVECVGGPDAPAVTHFDRTKGATCLQKPVTGLDLLECHPFPPDTCTINFKTPAEIKKKKKMLDISSFGIFFRTLQRRILTLGMAYCGIDEIADFLDRYSHKLTDMAYDISCIDRSETTFVDKEFIRHSTRQNRDIPCRGKIGGACFRGGEPLAPFWLFILIGEYIHVGKKATLGMGRYEIAELKHLQPF